MAGLSFSIEGVPFVAAGVYEHERDRFSEAAYGDGMTIYISFSAYRKLNTIAPIKLDNSLLGSTAAATGTANTIADALFNTAPCYELVMAEPVKGFAYSAVTDKFPVKNALFAENTYRFDIERLFHLLKNKASRSMSLGTFTIPYWENAARAAEDRAAMWLAGAVMTGVPPAALLLYGLIRSASRGKRRLEDDLLPEAKARGREFFREQSRKRWEKKHPGET